ncbi:MAG: hypothetical protein RL425_1307 [Pseudomonadota bacterium]|jgi:hypothetical protein
MRGTVSRFIGVGIGFARLVDVSSVKVVEVVDIIFPYPASSHRKSPAEVPLYFMTVVRQNLLRRMELDRRGELRAAHGRNGRLPAKIKFGGFHAE